MVNIIYENFLNSKDKYIIHQCNCVTTTAQGLEKTIFQAYPYSDVYSNRTKYSSPGKYIITGNGTINARYVVNLFSQYYPGTSNRISDNEKLRHFWFETALNDFGKSINNPIKITTIGMPNHIGCGLAGGNWEKYLKTIEKFEEKFNVIVSLYNIGQIESLSKNIE